MPELPEVETIVSGLKKRILNRRITDVWTDFAKIVKKPGFQRFKKEIIGKKILDVKRRGKNILIYLSQEKILLVHQKMTGHFLVGKWKKAGEKWKAVTKGPLSDDSANQFLHLVFRLNDGKQLALSDMRKFAKVELWNEKNMKDNESIRNLGPEPLEKNFSFAKFLKLFSERKGKIKQVLMDQTVVAGIGNIYSDEILWAAKINPLKDVSSLKKDEFRKIYLFMKEILKKAIKEGGESISDFRNIEGNKGAFDRYRMVYRRENEKCSRCGVLIKRIKLGGRSAHFCPKCQPI
ncbi:MAG: bifunctional DNA-formamidopyrimidine glycosylase/DNA-(apurinic or apyrimidinic site) lyase [Candidatus Parcubacteria bacterium]|nr:bifunctional DNA-formamidopyrimidine glycosylase/DNA-(apurinic or apyrimidinic site) lyase [Candidatus Parcubacteria bacterium]